MGERLEQLDPPVLMGILDWLHCGLRASPITGARPTHCSNSEGGSSRPRARKDKRLVGLDSGGGEA
eukprot:8871686-Alexandrium_andersonii.AAC.1